MRKNGSRWTRTLAYVLAGEAVALPLWMAETGQLQSRPRPQKCFVKKAFPAAAPFAEMEESPLWVRESPKVIPWTYRPYAAPAPPPPSSGMLIGIQGSGLRIRDRYSPSAVHVWEHDRPRSVR